MARKLTAIVLFSLMVVVTATSHSAVRYCLCQEALFVGDCACHPSISPDSTDACSATSAGDNDCCSECPEKDSEEGESKKEAQTFQSHDCSIVLFIEIDQFTISEAPGPSKKQPTSSFLINSPGPETALSISDLNRSLNGTRGPPPLLAMTPSVPLFLRHSVFLV